MAYYDFEVTKGTIDTSDVKNIITLAGKNRGEENKYDQTLYTYDESTTKKVIAKGPGTMAVSPLEDAGRELDFKTIRVLHSSMDSAGGAVAKYGAGPFGPLPRTMGNMLGATGYGIKINMDDDTVKRLSDGGFLLYCFKGVQADIGGGIPVVWFRSDDYGTQTLIDWKVQYEAYTSRSEIVPGGQITGISPYEIDLGQSLEVENAQGTGTVVAGTDGIISIENLSDAPMTSGISEVVNNVSQPLCAIPLSGNSMNMMIPVQKVLLTFSTNVMSVGTVVAQCTKRSVLVDLTRKSSREVTYHIDKGWSWGGGAWAQEFRPNTTIVPLLVEMLE